MSILNNEQIIKYREMGEIVIEPFNIKNLKTSSYDVRLGENYFREQKKLQPIDEIDVNYDIYNIYDENMVKKVWGEPQKALPYSYYKEKGVELKNIKDDDKIIFIGPGETILGHTIEFIGGVSRVTTMMHARSSIGRNFLKTCSCAGYGDVNFKNIWCMELQNSSTQYKIPLVVGRRIAQISFIEIQPINMESAYNKDGKYQTSDNVSELMKIWTPYDLLPKIYKDYEVSENN